MRNLKKILALVLALVMSLSLMATAGAADTTATDTSPYQTAVDVLKGVSVVKGDDRGDRLSDPITRAEVTALLYRIATGDVADTQTSIHTGQGFTDVNANDWYAGYISYCYIAEIIKGNPNGTFQPDNYINGYATLAMILRAMGYDKKGEFVGDGWEIRTASTAKQIGILEGITDTQLSGNASRALVFQILFRAIFKDTVRYNALHEDYDPTGENLAKLNLGLEEITGVVVANEIADLGNSSPLAAGRTNLLVGEKTYKLNDFSTTAEEIGTSIHAYVKGSKVLAHEDAGSDIKDNEGAATSVKSLRDELSITDATEYYVNFDPVLKDTSDWVITYKAPVGLVEALGLSNAELTANGCTLKTDGWNKTIRVGAKITAIDMAIIQEIFEYDDGEFDGEVYAGTSPDDRSNTMTWKKFRAEFLNLDENDAISACDNGEWLRVIDSDNDGVVDYVLRTDFVMTTVTDYEKRTDVYEVEWKGGLPNGNGKGTIPASAIIKASEDTDLSVGSVILYTLIDGNYYVCNPDVVTLTVDKKSVNAKAGTFTADGETYTWSGIDEKAVKYYDTVSQLAYETKYDMYPDHFGYIRLATETSRNFVLLTDGYYSTDNRKEVFKADLYDGENAVYDAEINDLGYRSFLGEGFIDTYEDDHLGNRSTWLRLNTFGEFYAVIDDNSTTGIPPIDNDDNVDTPATPGTPGTSATKWWVHYADRDANTYTNGVCTDGDWTYYADPFYTNIALGSENDGVWSLEDVENLDVEYNGLYHDYNTYELTGKIGFTSKDLWGITSWNSDGTVKTRANQAIQANGRTLYYYVENPGKHGEDLKVQSWVGYQNVPEALEKAEAVHAYAVTHEVYLADNELEQYEIADVVVIEGVPGDTVRNPQLILTGITPKRERALGSDGETYTEHDTEFALFERSELLNVITTDADGLYGPQLNFYDGSLQDGTGKYIPITSNFASYGIYAGYVTVLNETKNNYVELTSDGLITSERIKTFKVDDIAVYEIDQDTSRNWHGTDNVSARQVYNVGRQDMLIVMCDGDGNVQLAVNVSRSGVNGETYRNADGTYSEQNCIDKLYELFIAILRDREGDVVSYLYQTFGPNLLNWGYLDLEDGVATFKASSLNLSGYVWNDGTATSMKNAIQVFDETVQDEDGNDKNVTSTVEVTVTQVNDGDATIRVTGLNETRYIQVEYALDARTNFKPEVYTLDAEGYIYHENGAPLYTDEEPAPVQILDTIGTIGGKLVNKDFEIGEVTGAPQTRAAADTNDGLLSAGETVKLWFNHLATEPIALGDVEVRTNTTTYLYALDIQPSTDSTTQNGYIRYEATFMMPAEKYTFTTDNGYEITLPNALNPGLVVDDLWFIFWEGEAEPPVVEDKKTMDAPNLPEGIELVKVTDGAYKDYEGVAAEYQVKIPVTNTATKISFELLVPTGQIPYAPANQENVASVTLTKREAVASQSADDGSREVKAQTLAAAAEPNKVPADVYDVVITLKDATTATTVEILLLEKNYKEPVAPPATELPADDDEDGVIKLDNDVVLDSRPDLTGISKIDLNGFSITFPKDLDTSNEAAHKDVAILVSEDLTITGGGTIALDPKDGDHHLIGVTGDATLTIEGGVTLAAGEVGYSDDNEPYSSVIAVHSDADGATVNVGNATLTGVCGIIVNNLSANNTVNIKKGAEIEVQDWAIYFGGSNTLNVTGGSIYGDVGGIEVACGTVNITGGTISYNDDNVYRYPRPLSGGSITFGAAVSVAPRATTKKGAVDTKVTIGAGATLEGACRLGFVLRDAKANYSSSDVEITYVLSVTEGYVTFLDDENWKVNDADANGRVKVELAD